MIQTVVTYGIVALAVAWLVWTLLLPASLRERLRRGHDGAAKRASDCGDGCAACDGCPSAEPPPKHHKANTASDQDHVT